MDIQIKNKNERILSGNYQYLQGLRDDVLSYIDNFSLENKKIYDYTHVSFVFESYPILSRFYPSDKKKITSFIYKVCDHVIEDFLKLDPDETDAINNFQSHRLKVVSTGGLVMKSKKYMDWVEKEIKNFISKNINKDGVCFDFLIRDSLTYVTYTLTPLLETCVNLWKFNRNIYYFYIHPETKSSIIGAVRWLLPYIKGYKKNIMFVNSIYDSDKNKKEYKQIWCNKDALNLINLCINFDRTLVGLYNQ